MDTLTATKQRAHELEGQITALQARHRETEVRLAGEHGAVRQAAVERGNLLESLTDADPEAARRLHRRIDELDSAIRAGERVAEGLQRSLAKLAQERESLSSELQRVQGEIAREEKAAAFQVWQVQIKQGIRAAGESLAAARTDLAELNILAVKGGERFGQQAEHFMSPLLEALRNAQHNPEQHGWRAAVPFYPAFFNPFSIRPMKRQ